MTTARATLSRPSRKTSNAASSANCQGTAGFISPAVSVDVLNCTVETMAKPNTVGSGAYALHHQAAHVMGEDEAELLERAGAGEASAFRILVERHIATLNRVAGRILRDATEAEDVTQEALLRLWRAAGELDIGAGGVGPWLRRVATNLAIDRLRAGRRLDVTDQVPDQDSPATQLSALDDIDRAHRVDAAISALPDRQRVALTLFHFEGMSQREVAGALGVSEDALESLLARARRALRAALQDEWRELLSD